METRYSIGVLFLFILGFNACVDDGSTLGEKELSEITISVDHDTLTAYFREEFILDRLKVEQSGEELPLTYEWAYGNLDVVDGKVQPYPIKDSLHVVSHDPKIRYAFPKLGAYGLRLKVENGESICFKYFILRVDTEFAEGITILSSDEYGKGRLSFMKTLSREEIGAGIKSSFRTDLMEYVNPHIQLEEVTDMIQANGRLLVCSGSSGRIYNMDARTFDVESMTSFKADYPDCSFRNFMGITVRDNMYISTDDKKVFTYDLILNELIPKEQEEKICLEGAALGVRPVFVNYATSVLYCPRSLGGFYQSSKQYNDFSILKACFIGDGLYVISIYKAIPSFVYLAKTNWSFRVPDILQFAEGPDPLPMDRNSILVGSRPYGCAFFTFNNEIYRWEPPKMLPGTSSLSVPDGMTITAMSMDSDEKLLYVGLHEADSPAPLKGSLFIYDAKTLSLVGEYRHVADKPIKIIYKTRD